MTYADRIPLTRPVPTRTDRPNDARGCGHTEQQHRHTDTDVEQLAATVRVRIGWPISAGEAGTIVTVVLDALAAAGRLTNGRPTPHLDTVQAELDRLRAELGRALDALATIRDAHEHADRALATHDTAPESTPPPDLGSPAGRAQDAKPCRGCFACSTAPDCQTEREG